MLQFLLQAYNRPIHRRPSRFSNELLIVLRLNSIFFLVYKFIGVDSQLEALNVHINFHFYPTDPFTIPEPQNPSIVVSMLHKIDGFEIAKWCVGSLTSWLFKKHVFISEAGSAKRKSIKNVWEIVFAP